MKFIFFIGGFSGLLVTGTASYLSDHQPDRILVDASVGCLAGAILFRWFWTVLLGGIRETILQRHAAATASAKSK
jgi:hypothetical protein